MQCNDSCCCRCSPVSTSSKRGEAVVWPGAEKEGGGHMVNATACPLAVATAAAGCEKITTILFLLQVFFFLLRFVVAFNRFSAIQNYSRMKIKNMFSGKFNTRVDSGKQTLSFIQLFIHALTRSLQYSFIHSLHSKLLTKSFVKRAFPRCCCMISKLKGEQKKTCSLIKKFHDFASI